MGSSAEALLRLPVRLHGIRLGRTIDVLLEPATLRAVGLEVRCGDGVDRFVPLPAVRVTEDEIAVRSALMLLDEGNLTFYKSRGRTLRSVRGSTVTRGGRRLGELVDLVVDADGAPLELVLAGGRRIPFDDRLRVAGPGRASAA